MDDQQPRGTFEGRPRPPDADSGRLATVVFGLIVIAIGVWFLLDRTFGFELPDIEWGSLWPLIVIALGAWILLGAGNRRR
jgi:predicted secreted protein